MFEVNFIQSIRRERNPDVYGNIVNYVLRKHIRYTENLDKNFPSRTNDLMLRGLGLVENPSSLMFISGDTRHSYIQQQITELRNKDESLYLDMARFLAFDEGLGESGTRDFIRNKIFAYVFLDKPYRLLSVPNSSHFWNNLALIKRLDNQIFDDEEENSARISVRKYPTEFYLFDKYKAYELARDINPRMVQLDISVLSSVFKLDRLFIQDFTTEYNYHILGREVGDKFQTFTPYDMWNELRVKKNSLADAERMQLSLLLDDYTNFV